MTSQSFSRGKRRRRRRPSAQVSVASSAGAPPAEQRHQPAAPPTSATAGEGRDIAQKLGMKSGYIVCLINPPEKFYGWLSEQLPPGCRLQLGLPRQPTKGIALYWPESAHSLENALDWVRTRLTDDGTIWVMVPKKRHRGEGDSAVSFEAVQQAGQKIGLVDNEQFSLSDTEYAVRLVVRRERRSPPSQAR